MQDLMPILVVAALGSGLALSAGYWQLAIVYLERWHREAVPLQNVATPPVTFLRPIKRGVPRLAENLDGLVQAARPDDQIVFGFDEDSEAAEMCEKMRMRFPARDIVAAACAPGAALNPKISKLLQMTPHARHEHWILSDSEAELTAEFLDAFRAEWAASKADVLTAGYRFVHLNTWKQQLDAAAVLLNLWPGLAFLRRFNRVRLTLGACTAVRRGEVAAVGGWATFGDDLAEDNRLGAALVKSGRTVRLSAEVVTLTSEPLSWREYWRHQRRVAVTYRVSNPAGFAGSIVTHCVLFGALAVLLVPYSEFGIPFLAFAWGTRWLAARHAAQLLDFPIPHLGRVVFLASFVETACWVLAWFSRKVWWAEKWWRVSRAGKLRPV